MAGANLGPPPPRPPHLSPAHPRARGRRSWWGSRAQTDPIPLVTPPALGGGLSRPSVPSTAPPGNRVSPRDPVSRGRSETRGCGANARVGAVPKGICLGTAPHIMARYRCGIGYARRPERGEDGSPPPARRLTSRRGEARPAMLSSSKGGDRATAGPSLCAMCASPLHVQAAPPAAAASLICPFVGARPTHHSALAVRVSPLCDQERNRG